MSYRTHRATMGRFGRAFALGIAAWIPAAVIAPATAAAETTITFMDLGPERKEFNEEVIRRFEEANPDIKVDYRWQANEPYKTGIKVMMESNSPPDVLFNWAGSSSNDFVDAGVVRDLSDSFERGDEWTTDMPVGVVNQYRYKDGLYGVPSQVYTKTFFKNDAFFEENDLEVPETMDELIGMCSAVREIDPQMTPIAFGASESWTINHYLTILFQRHVDLETAMADYTLDRPADELFTDPGYLAALNDFERMTDADCFNAGINSVTPEVSRTMFASGLAATTFCGSWCPPQFDEQGAEGTYSPFAFPAVAGGKGDQTGALVGVQGYQIAAESQAPEEAVKFLSYLVSPDNNAMLAEMVGQLPANASRLKDGALSNASTQMLDGVAKAKASVPPLNTIVETSVSDVILKSGQDLVADTITPEEFMDRVREQARTAKERRG